ncbi:hypothetical protein PFISCL1PPCAC_362, partial [Pristionchus fissidentatus]
LEMEEKPEQKVDTSQFDFALEEALRNCKLPQRDDRVANQKNDSYGRRTNVFLNVFNLSLDKMPKTIYKYELTFSFTKKDGSEYFFHNAQTKVTDFVRSRRRAALLMLQRMLHEENEAFFVQQLIGERENTNWRRCCAFDCGSSYYTAVDLPNASGVIPEGLWKQFNEVLIYMASLKGDIKWELRKAETFPIDGENGKTPQALQFFDILSQQKLDRDATVDSKPDASYVRDQDQPTDNKVLRKGIVNATKVVGDQVCIQMDSKISLFYPSMPLIEYVKKASGKHNPADLERFLRDKVTCRALRKDLLNIPLTMRHMPKRKTFECKGFSADSALDTTFELKSEGRIINVAEYFERTYNYKLKFPQLPLVIENARGGGKSYHPIEVLQIPDGVRVSNQKMSKQAQENMISRSCRAPGALGKDIEEGKWKAQLGSAHNPYFSCFNIGMATKFSSIDAKILHKPNISGLGGKPVMIDDRGMISYLKGGFQFADAAKPDKPVMLLTLSNAVRREEAEQIKGTLARVGGEFGMKITFANIRDPELLGGQIEPLREFMMCNKNNVSMFFFVTREKMDESHYMVKKLEQEVGVVTQLICGKTAQGVGKGMRTTVYNVIAKMNQKLGGVVANPSVPPELKRQNPDAYERAARDWYQNRMFVGFTLSHAGAQSFADRLVGEEVREPTCVGMAFTLRQPGKRTAMSWFQEKRKAVIDDIQRHFVRALDIYAESNKGQMPSSLLVFRKGMSEGELRKAAYEMKQVMAAVKEVASRPCMEKYRPSVQSMVCMSNTPDRLFFQDGTQNVPAGTVLDKDATNPERQEFIIVPHNAIKGTAKAVRCTLVFEHKGREGRCLEYAELQSILHSMCYLNGVAASPTRLPVPLSDSEKAAERQMNLFKESMRSGDDTISMSSGRSGTGLMHDGSADFYQKLSDAYAHKFRTNQYYA